jgi:hypothetical protein
VLRLGRAPFLAPPARSLLLRSKLSSGLLHLAVAIANHFLVAKPSDFDAVYFSQTIPRRSSARCFLRQTILSVGGQIECFPDCGRMGSAFRTRSAWSSLQQRSALCEAGRDNKPRSVAITAMGFLLRHCECLSTSATLYAFAAACRRSINVWTQVLATLKVAAAWPHERDRNDSSERKDLTWSTTN